MTEDGRLSAIAASSSEVMSYCERRRLLMYHFGRRQQLSAPQRASRSDICAVSKMKFAAALQTTDFLQNLQEEAENSAQVRTSGRSRLKPSSSQL